MASRARVLVTGGGTAGHIYPLIAVATELQIETAKQKRNIKIRYVGAADKEYRGLLRENGMSTKSILGSKFRRYFSVLNLVDTPKLAISFLQSLWKVFWFMPDVVFSTGGSGAVAVVLAARFYRIPVVVHESDSVPSVTSKITGRFARVIAVSFESAAPYFTDRKGRLIFTGEPIRRVLFSESMTQEKAKAFFRFDKKLPLILVLGGSQGAVGLNDFFLDNLDDFLPVTQIFHQTGKKHYNQVFKEFSVLSRELPKALSSRYKAIGYFEKDIRIALTAADIVVSRAGASGIFEIAAFRKPSILVPLPKSANNHQLNNALEYEKTGAAIVFEQDNLLPQLFLARIEKLFSDPQELVKMSRAAEVFYMPGAALNLANIILTIKEQ